MPVAIGFRVEPSAVHIAAVEGSAEAPILLDAQRHAAPKALGEGQALKWYRDRVAVLLDGWKPDLAAIKYMETTTGGGRGAPRASEGVQKRLRMEGVILELLVERDIETITGTYTGVRARLGTKSARKYVDQNDLRGIDWAGKSQNLREAILTATSVLPGR